MRKINFIRLIVSFMVKLISCFSITQHVKRCVCVLFFLLPSGELFASVTDSLKNLLASAGEDTNKVNILNDLCWEYWSTEPHKTIRYAKQSLKLAHSLNYTKGIANAHAYLSAAYKVLGKFYIAIEHGEKSLEYNKKRNDHKQIALSYSDLGLIYRNIGDYPKAQEYVLKSLEHLDENSDSIVLASMHNNVSIIYDFSLEHEEALKHSLRAISYMKFQPESPELGTMYGRLGSVYTPINTDSAFKYLFKGLDILKKYDDKDGLSDVLHNIGYAYEIKGDHKKALEYMNQSLAIDLESGYLINVAKSYLSIGAVYADYKPLEARQYFEKSLQLASQVQAPEVIMFVYDHIHKMYINQNKPDSAYAYLIKYNTMRDSVFGMDRKKQMLELTAYYKNEFKEQKIKLLEQKQAYTASVSEKRKLWLIAAAGFLVMLIIITLLYIRQRKMKEKQKSLELEQKALRTQVNPHFIFNCLNSIQNLINKGDDENANHYLTKFADLLRNTLEHSRHETISLAKELESLQLYVDLETLRFEDAFEYEVRFTGFSVIDDVQVPPLLLQPFVENSIKHGLLQKKGKGVIILSIHKENEHLLCCTIQDNGVGRKTAEQNQSAHDHKNQSLGVQITQDRILAHYNTYKYNLKFVFTDLYTENGTPAGTKVEIRIPV